MLNRALRFSIFLLLAVSSSAQSSELWKEGWTNSTHPTPELACDKDFQQWSLYNSGVASSLHVEAEYRDSTRYWCRYKFNSNGAIYQSSTVTKVSGSCPSGYVDNGSGQCVIEPQCPAQGTVRYTQGLVIGIGEGITANYGGCEYSLDSVTDCWYDLATSDTVCGTRHVATGNTSTLPESTGELEDIPIVIPANSSTDTTQSTSDTDYTSTGPDTAPDGTTTESQTETKTDVKGQGTVIDNGDNSITIKNSDGSISIYSKNKVTTTYPDGSRTETTTENTTKESQGSEYTYINKSTGGITTNNTSNVTNNYSQSTTKNYDSAGNLTDTSSTSTGDSTTGEDIGAGEGEGECNPLIESCEGSGEFTASDKTGLYEKTDKTFDTVLTEFKTTVEASPIGSAMNGFFDVSVGGTCPVWTATVPVFGAIIIDAQCSSAMTSIWPIISAVLLVMAGFFAWRVAIE